MTESAIQANTPFDERRCRRYRYVPAAAAIAAFLFFAGMLLTGQRHAYEEILHFVGVYPHRLPFLDTQVYLSAVRCANLGIDPYVANFCDPLGRPYLYSPLWMSLAVLPVSEAWTVPVGLLTCAIFLGSLFLLPPGRNACTTGLIALGAISNAALFAMERGNNDLILFALVAAAAATTIRPGPVRHLGYGFILLAGWLKYYPLATMALAAQERPTRVVAIAFAAAVLTALASGVMWPELGKSFGNIEAGDVLGDTFGSANLPGGIGLLLGLSPAAQLAFRLALSLLSMGLALRLAMVPDLSAAFNRLRPAEQSFLLAGALMIGGCFFTAQNVGYRAVHLLLALPALLALATPKGAALFKLAAGLALGLLLWNPGWRNEAANLIGALGGQGWRTAALWLFWATREAAWWALITLLSAFVVTFLLQASILRQLSSSLSSSRRWWLRTPEPS